MDPFKGIVVSLIRLYLIFFVFSYFLVEKKLSQDFGFVVKDGAQPSNYLNLMIFFMLLEPLFFFLNIFMTKFSRVMEFNADVFSVD